LKGNNLKLIFFPFNDVLSHKVTQKKKCFAQRLLFYICGDLIQFSLLFLVGKNDVLDVSHKIPDKGTQIKIQ